MQEFRNVKATEGGAGSGAEMLTRSPEVLYFNHVFKERQYPLISSAEDTDKLSLINDLSQRSTAAGLDDFDQFQVFNNFKSLISEDPTGVDLDTLKSFTGTAIRSAKFSKTFNSISTTRNPKNFTRDQVQKMNGYQSIIQDKASQYKISYKDLASKINAKLEGSSDYFEKVLTNLENSGTLEDFLVSEL